MSFPSLQIHHGAKTTVMVLSIVFIVSGIALLATYFVYRNHSRTASVQNTDVDNER